MATPHGKVVIVGSGGRLGAAFMREFAEKFELTGFNHAQLDLTRHQEIHEKIGALDFDVLINCAAMTNVDLCEKESERAMQINGAAVRALAQIAAKKNARMVHISTDYVFDGTKREPYTEDERPNPVSVYGQSKARGEFEALDVSSGHIVLRVSWVFGPDRPSFIDGIIKGARERDQVEAVADKYSSPTYTADLAAAMPQMFQRDFPGGILHFANSGEASWQSYGQQALDYCREFGIELKTSLVRPTGLADVAQFIAQRPVYTVLSARKYAQLAGRSPRSWREALRDYIRDHYAT